MKLEGERTLPGRPEEVWKMLLDPDVLVAAIPGCERLERVGEDHYEGRIEAKVGSVESRYDTTFRISEKDPPRSYRLRAEGDGPAGFVEGDARMRMAPASGSGSPETLLSYDIDARVGGRIAQVGQRMIRATASAMIDKGFGDLRDRIELERQPDEQSRAAVAAQQRARGGLGKRLRDFLRAAKVFLKTLLARPSSAGGSGSTDSAVTSRKDGRSRPSEGQSESRPEGRSEGRRAPAGSGDTGGMPAPPSASAGSGENGSPSPSKKKNDSAADTSGMLPPPGAS